ncbi:ABC transporter ATP-binding protein [Streptomyces bauhiniae]|uniref:ABC transporter ATP-binding protein n=1 Tax=Streptomyces bauhiniae TaxID=2340725 RepID=UPI0033B40EF7
MKYSADRGLWLRVLRLLALDRTRLAASICVVLAMVASGMVGPVLLKQVVDVALPRHDVALLSELCSAMLIAAVLSSVFTVLMAWLNQTIGQNLVHKLRTDIFRSTQRMPLHHFTTHSVSDVQTRVSSDIDGISNVVTFAAQGMLGSAAILVTSAVIMLMMSWPIALVSLTLALALNILNNRYARKRRRLTHTQQRNMTSMVQFVGEHLSFSGVLLGRTLGRETWQAEQFEGMSRQTADVVVQERLAGRSALATISMTLALLPILAYWAAGTVLDGVSLGSVIVIAALQTQISSPLQQLMQLWAEVQGSRAFFERIFEVLDEVRTLPYDEVGATFAKPAESVTAIRLEDVQFSYPGHTEKALDSVTLDIPVGRRVFVTGESGSGKSTMALLLAGLITPQEGSVSVFLDSGRRIDDIRAAVTLVPQESTLFNLSIRENLAFGNPACSAQDMIEALHTVELGPLLARLPDGLDSIVGDRGAKVSGGERQRLAVARSLLADYPVMVFDEFSSGLDEATSEAVFVSLLRRITGKTLIVVTHRLPTLHEGDVVVTMDQGRVITPAHEGVSSG